MTLEIFHAGMCENMPANNTERIAKSHTHVQNVSTHNLPTTAGSHTGIPAKSRIKEKNTRSSFLARCDGYVENVIVADFK